MSGVKQKMESKGFGKTTRSNNMYIMQWKYNKSNDDIRQDDKATVVGEYS